MKTYQKVILSLFLALLITAPAVSFAASVRGGNYVNIESEEIQDNLYIGAGQSDIKAKVEGDLVVGSGESRINSEVVGDVIVLGGTVFLDGVVEGDVRILGGEVYIQGDINGELLVIGGEVHIESDSKLDNDVILIGGNIFIEGESSGDFRIIGGKVSLNNSLSGNANITTQNLSFGNNSFINGAVYYFAPDKAFQYEGAEINGEISYNQINTIRDSGVVKQAILSFISFWILLKFVTTLLLTFILVFVFKVFSQQTTEYGIKSIGRSLLIGILSTILIPIVVFVLFISLIAMPLSILILLAYFFFLIISFAVAGIILGSLIKKVFTKSDSIEISFNTATLGVVILTIVQFVPVLGDLTRLFFFLVAFGAITHYIYMNIRWRKP
jgi:cytoskeletal protein CcmA (bactofilin family)